MRRLCSAWLARFLAVLPLVSHAAAVIGSPTAVLIIVVDSTTAIPGGSGNFTAFVPQDPIFPPDPAISAGNVAFWGAGITGQQGIHALRYGTLVRVPDLNTAVPGGSGTFFSGRQTRASAARTSPSAASTTFYDEALQTLRACPGRQASWGGPRT